MESSSRKYGCANAIAELSTSAKLTSSAGAVLLVVSTRPDQPCRLTGSLGQGWRESLAMDHRIIERGEWPGRPYELNWSAASESVQNQDETRKTGRR